MTSKLLKTGLALMALLLTPFTAQAADMPVKGYRSVVAYYNWTGFYAGLNAGYGWGTSNWDSPAVTINPKGAMFGLTAGYNWQLGNFVYGLEGDIAYSMVRGSVACGAATCETRNNWLGTARGRIGFAVDRFLPYVTGGAAFGDVKATNFNPGFASGWQTRFGYTFGGGLEYAFMGNWTAKLEYLYVNLGRFDCGTACSLTTPRNVSFSENIVRLGLNYKFNGPLFSRF